MIPPPPTSPLFPYTTLFRSSASATASTGTTLRRSPTSPARRRSAGRRSYCELRSEEHTSELQSRPHLVCRLLLEKKKLLAHEPSALQHHPLRRPQRTKPAIP